MARTVKIRAPAGTDEANVGTRLYSVDDAGDVEVPDFDVPAILAIPGFELEPVPDPPAGFVRVVAPDGTTADGTATLSYGGVTYTIAADLTVIVPAEAVGDLLSHGFTPAVVVPGLVLTDADAEPAPAEPAPPTE